jgi:DNA-binding MarR family transcriptional regulator
MRARAVCAAVATAQHEPLNVLERALGLSQPAAVRLADRLAQRGLVQRRRDGHDRRGVRLSLTSHGRAAADAALREGTGAVEALLGTIGMQARLALEPVLEQLLAAATASRADARTTCRLCDAVACGHPAHCPSGGPPTKRWASRSAAALDGPARRPRRRPARRHG